MSLWDKMRQSHWRKNNPVIASTFASGLVIVAAPAIAVTPIISTLQYVGFGAGGIVGGT
jgi:hypothetical protein